MTYEFNREDPLHAEAADFAGPDSRVLWMHETNLGPASAPTYRELHALTLDDDRDEVTVVRGWASSPNPPAVSVDMVVPLAAVTGKYNPSNFAHGNLFNPRLPHSEAEAAFAREVGGAVAFLWKYEFDGLASFVARVATVGQEEVVAGNVVKDADAPEGQDSYVVTVSLRVPLEEFGAKAPALAR